MMESSRDFHLNLSFRLQATEELAWAKAYSKILCNSQFSRESILRAYNLESEVCYLGIDTEQFKPIGSTKDPYVVGAGSIHYTKRIPAAIRAISLIPNHSRPRLVWIANYVDNFDKISILKLAEELEVAITLKILVSDQELQYLMAHAACFLYTSHLEPFGLTPLEANACGTAVVAIGEGGVRETVIQGVNGFRSLDNNPNELAEHVIRFTENLDYAKQLGLQAREHVVKQWSVPAAIDRLENHLFSIAS
jgi:glycosyltransferase involved in cell wall biosynthesis